MTAQLFTSLFLLALAVSLALVVAINPLGVMEMWEPYAGLIYLNRPTEFAVLKADEHALRATISSRAPGCASTSISSIATALAASSWRAREQ